MPESPRVVVDTNVLVAGLRSNRRERRTDCSPRLAEVLSRSALSVPLVLEYEDALVRHAAETGLTRRDVDAVLDYFCSVGHLQTIFFLWRPLLPDPKDDMVVELAVAAGCRTIVTYNVRDFRGAKSLGVSTRRPAEFLRSIGVLS